METQYKYSTRFDGLLPKSNYLVTLSTELDGKTITQVNMGGYRGNKNEDFPKIVKEKKAEKQEKKKPGGKKK